MKRVIEWITKTKHNLLKPTWLLFIFYLLIIDTHSIQYHRTLRYTCRPLHLTCVQMSFSSNNFDGCQNAVTAFNSKHNVSVFVNKIMILVYVIHFYTFCQSLVSHYNLLVQKYHVITTVDSVSSVSIVR